MNNLFEIILEDFVESIQNYTFRITSFVIYFYPSLFFHVVKSFSCFCECSHFRTEFSISNFNDFKRIKLKPRDEKLYPTEPFCTKVRLYVIVHRIKMSLCCVDDFENHARETLSQPIFSYYGGGACSEETLLNNRTSFSRCENESPTLTCCKVHISIS